MSEFLQDLLKKVKKSADELDAPLDEPDSQNDGSAFDSKRKKSAKPGGKTKPGLITPVEGEPGLPSEPSLVGKPFSVHLFRKLTDYRQEINAMIPSMKDSELRLYSYLVERAYGNQKTASDGVIPYSQKEAMKATGIKSTATIVKSMNSLSKRKLIKWVRKSRKRGEASQIRVFIPRDTQESFVHSHPSTSE
jgi:hypothetical protein